MNIDKINSTGDPSSWKTICITKGEMPIGRASAKHAERVAKKSNMFFENRHLSKTHARFSIANSVFHLEDLSSTFGTVWNNNLLVPFKKVALSEGDRIGFVLNKPSKSIQDIIKKARDSDMISMDILLNPLVQMVFSVVSFDADEGSIVLLPLSGLDSLTDSRKANQARRSFISSDTETWGEISQNKLKKTLKSASPFEVSTPAEESDDPPIEESYERRFCISSQHNPCSSQDQPIKEVVNSEMQSVVISCSDPPFPLELVEIDSRSLSDANYLKVKPASECTSVAYSSDIENESKNTEDVISSDDAHDSEISDDCDDADSSKEDVELEECSESEISESHKSYDTLSAHFAFPEVSDETKMSLLKPNTSREISTEPHEELQTEERISEDKQQEEATSHSNSVSEISITESVLVKANTTVTCSGDDDDDDDVEDDSSSRSLSDDAEEFGDELDIASDEDCIQQFGGRLNHIFDAEEDDDVAFDTLDYSSDEEAHSSGEESIQAVELTGNPEGEPDRISQKINILDLLACSNDADNTESSSMGDNKDNDSDAALLETVSESKGTPQISSLSTNATVSSQHNRKRAHDTMESSDEQDTEVAENVDTPAPKKAKSKSIVREIGKGLFYVTGTLVALVAYGGYLEKSGAQ
ncbi:hypothetical protein JCM33374_g4646 [Metschnikowia sp. JCM 33374]|nr:hypothetical protein JCM33374_g4646 [Metschnikowia sp. JCM 33374]